MLVALRQCRVKTLSPHVNNLATSLEAVKRHPKDPDDLPATHAWRTEVESILAASEKLDKDDEDRWTRVKLARKCKTSPSQILKLLNGTTKSSPIVRRINKALRISFMEPLPISKERANIIDMMMQVDDLEWLEQTISMIMSKK